MARKLWETLLKSALDAQEYEITCTECFSLLDQFADLLLEGADPSQIMPRVKQHLSHCPDCLNQFEVLITMLQEAASQDQPSSVT